MARRSLPLLLAVLALSAAACASTGDADFESAEEPAEVIVTASRGEVVVRANTASGTEVRWDASGATPSVTLDGGVLTITDDCDTDCSVDYTVLVGDEADVTVLLGKGNVAVSDVDGTVVITVEDGDVSLNTLVGSFDVEISGEGDILGARLEGTVGTFLTGSGFVDVTFDSSVTELVIESGKGDVTAQLPGGPYAVDATASGSVDILVDEDAAAAGTVVITTADGDATVYKK